MVPRRKKSNSFDNKDDNSISNQLIQLGQFGSDRRINLEKEHKLSPGGVSAKVVNNSFQVSQMSMEDVDSMIFKKN